VFSKPTVFIIGAGASAHYGFPTGESLVHEVIQKAEVARKYFLDHRDIHGGYLPGFIRDEFPNHQLNAPYHPGWEKTGETFRKLAERLRAVDPLVIDYFLGQNAELQTAGKILIAWIIREAETKFHRWEEDPQRNRTSDRYNWVRFVLHRLAVPCEKSEDLKRNNVTFITFNYDTSLEDRIERGLRQISLFDQKDIAEFISPDRFLHVYGTIRNDTYPTYTPLMPLHQPGGKIDLQHAAQFFDQMHCISKGIRTIDPHDKVDDVILTRARNAIKSATCFYVLGFGFDRNNCRRIGLEQGVFNSGTPAPYKNVVFTNLADSNRINKDASRAFCGTPDNFFNTFCAHGNLVAYPKPSDP
jgi:hypothetical protein